MNEATMFEEEAQRTHPPRAIARASFEPTCSLRELDHRANDGIDVRLLWDAQTDRVSLALTDERSGESFTFEVDASEALSAFHHPFAYATDDR